MLIDILVEMEFTEVAQRHRGQYYFNNYFLCVPMKIGTLCLLIFTLCKFYNLLYSKSNLKNEEFVEFYVQLLWLSVNTRK
jgi:hypothetical protein